MPAEASAKQKERARKFGLSTINSYTKKQVNSKLKGKHCTCYKVGNGRVVKVIHGVTEGRGLPFGKILKYARETLRATETSKAPADRRCLARFYGVAIADKKWGLEYEWVEGQSLDEWDYSKHTPSELARVMNCAAKGLLHLNDKKLSHTGLRAHDIVVKPDGSAVIVDYHNNGKTKAWAKQVARRLLGTVLYETVTGEKILTRDGRQNEPNAYHGARASHADRLANNKNKKVTPFKALLRNLLKEGNTGLKTAINTTDRIASRVSKSRRK